MQGSTYVASPPPPPPPPPPPADGDSSGGITPSKLAAPADEVMIDRVGGYEHDNLAQILDSVSPDEGQSAIKDSTMDDTGRQHPPANFHVPQNRESVMTDVSDSAPSPSLVNASAMTPTESDSERDGERARLLPGVGLERVQQLQVHDGA